VIFRHFRCISSGFPYHAAQKAYNFGKIFKLRPKDRSGLATPVLKYFFIFIIDELTEDEEKELIDFMGKHNLKSMTPEFKGLI
jgi:hypothetical protein